VSVRVCAFGCVYTDLTIAADQSASVTRVDALLCVVASISLIDERARGEARREERGSAADGKQKASGSQRIRPPGSHSLHSTAEPQLPPLVGPPWLITWAGRLPALFGALAAGWPVQAAAGCRVSPGRLSDLDHHLVCLGCGRSTWVVSRGTTGTDASTSTSHQAGPARPLGKLDGASQRHRGRRLYARHRITNARDGIDKMRSRRREKKDSSNDTSRA
jgi:hypothetical protein